MSERKFQKKLEKIRKQGERDKQEYELREAYAKYAPEKKKKKVSYSSFCFIKTKGIFLLCDVFYIDMFSFFRNNIFFFF